MRELGKPRLRELIDDPTRANPTTVMPPYGRHHILERARDRPPRGVPACASLRPCVRAALAAAVLLAPALALGPPSRCAPSWSRACGSAARRARAPTTRSAPRRSIRSCARSSSENADAAAASGVLEEGRKVWKRKFKNGRTLAGCFPNGGRRVAGRLSAVRRAPEARGHAGDGDQPVPEVAQGAAARRGRSEDHGGGRGLRALALRRPEDRRARAARGRAAFRGRAAPLLHAHGPAELRVRLVPRAGRGQALRGDRRSPRRWARPRTAR